MIRRHYQLMVATSDSQEDRKGEGVKGVGQEGWEHLLCLREVI